MNKAERRRRLARTFEKYIRLGLYDTSLDVFDICQRIRMSCVTAGSARDLFAVWELIRMLRAEGKREELRIFCEIYHSSSKSKMYGGCIKDAVIASSMKHFCDERTVYRKLAYVEKRYEQIRSGI